MRYKKELVTAKKAASEAAAIIRSFTTRQDYEIKLKGKNDLVTDADLASERIIIKILSAAFPEDLFLAEESARATELPEGRVWIIDPIDGTTNFAHRFPVYCVSIALWEAGVPKVDVVYEVNADELFWAVEGEGAWLNDNRISISEESDPGKALIGTGFPYTDLDMLDEYLQIFKILMRETHGVRRPGSAAWDLCNVACGRLDGFYEYGLKPWDVSAAALIVLEAGGIITDWTGTQNWLFGQRILAGNKPVTAFLNELIIQCIPADKRNNIVPHKES